MPHALLVWVGFNLLILLLLALDLGVIHRRAHVISLKEALFWSVIWVIVAFLFNLVVYFWRGRQSGMEFLTGYVIERSLSVDNLVVFVLIFAYFGVPPQYQHKVLFWGILGALVMRAVFIFSGVALIQKFHWIIYVFGVFLIYTGLKVAFQKEKEIHPEKNPVLKLFKRFAPVSDRYHGHRFFVKIDGRVLATPLFIVLLVVETTDLVFATDSIPAILAITYDPFIVYSSNVFAILGLRATYFALAGIMQFFRYLNYGVASVLVFIGVKMTIADLYKIPVGIALGVVCLLLMISVIASLLVPSKKRESG